MLPETTPAEKRGQPVAHLRIPEQFGHQEMLFPVYSGNNLIGRTRGHLKLGHDFVSALHAQIQDNESTNGTYFGENTVSIIPHRFYQMQHGQRIRFGRTYGVYEIAGAAHQEPSDAQELAPEFVAPKTPLCSGPAAHVKLTTEDERSRHEQRNNGNMPIFQTLPDSIIVTGKDDENTNESVLSTLQQQILRPPSRRKTIIDDLSSSSQRSFVAAEPDLNHLITAGDEEEVKIAPQSKNTTFSNVPEEQSAEDSQIEKCSVNQTKDLLINSSPLSSASSKSPVRNGIVSIVIEPLNSSPHKEFREKPEESCESPRLPSIKSLMKKRNEPFDEKILDVIETDDIKPQSATCVMIKSRAKRGRMPKSKEMEAETERENIEMENYRNEIVNKDEKPVSAIKKSSVKKTKLSVAANDDIKVKVLFTAVDPPNARIIKTLSGMGIEMVDSWKNCTHLVTDKIRRTTKFLCALSSGKQITSLDWIHSCQRTKHIVDCSSFRLQDPAKESQFQFSLQESLELVQRNGSSNLMKGLKFMITPSVQPDYGDMCEIIEASGGEILGDLPMKSEENIIIIGCSEDADLIKSYKSFGWEDRKIMTTEFILAGALRQTLDWSLRLSGGEGQNRHRKK